MAMVQQYSADGLLSLLEEDDQALRLYALQSLNKVVHDFWYQIASSIASVEAFYEDEKFSHRELAAVVASKVYGPTCHNTLPPVRLRQCVFSAAKRDCLLQPRDGTVST